MNTFDSLKFDSTHLTRPPTAGIDVVTTLAHFALVTYMVEPSALRPHVHERFALDLITADDGTQKALISVVPFLDLDFRFVRFPWKMWQFGQTNYRAYVTDRETGEHVVWFFGTSLSSWTVNIPRYVWKLPWFSAEITFNTQYDPANKRYTTYRMSAQSKWAPAELDLADSGEPPNALRGFPDLETGLVILTHPLYGYYYRRDATLGRYSIWHDRLQLTVGNVNSASFPLLDRLGLVADGDQSSLHSVLLQPKTEFTIYLPPTAA